MLELYRKLVAYGGMTFLGSFTYGVRAIAGQKGIKLNRSLFAPVIAKSLLAMVGVKVVNNVNQKLNKKNVCYFFNHNSFLDVFIIPLLGLDNTRFIITEGVKSILPLHMCNLGVDVLYIPDSHKTEERIAFFKQVSHDLRAGKYSVICSPEGRHDFFHGIAPFNRGVFHMALVGKTPIHTLFFNIPRDANPIEGPNMKPCTVRIDSMELIETKDWKLEELQTYIDSTRSKFLAYYHDTYGDYGESEL